MNMKEKMIKLLLGNKYDEVEKDCYYRVYLKNISIMEDIDVLAIQAVASTKGSLYNLEVCLDLGGVPEWYLGIDWLDNDTIDAIYNQIIEKKS